MWLFTTQGLYSVVAHRDDPDALIVRARARADIDALREQIPSLEPFEDPAADYRHRAVVSRAEWLAAVAQLVTEIDYDNFKRAVAARQGHERSQLYGRIWSILLDLQRDRAGDVSTTSSTSSRSSAPRSPSRSPATTSRRSRP
ncbi:MAG: hypothetical protein BroJett022_00040 [Actinomycetes bacterium]|nr:MAG: hypothetical protein BroJett022_00040 [Actinomycetes bacterium]